MLSRAGNGPSARDLEDSIRGLGDQTSCTHLLAGDGSHYYRITREQAAANSRLVFPRQDRLISRNGTRDEPESPVFSAEPKGFWRAWW